MPLLTGIEVLAVIGGLGLVVSLIPALFAAAKGGSFMKWWLFGGFVVAGAIFSALMAWLAKRQAGRKLLPREAIPSN